ncbi:hypothetical protein PG993_005874 [Apiospora rasikravindrae]|uniref:Uncharacterized protein n=1 Tax=Apiospora rasikravindrae TaxID=990691 RepID=A0ABR1TCD6_9PEZI
MDASGSVNPPSSANQTTSSSMASILGSASPGKLSHVVVIPQRRPKRRERGFIRAYAPDLLRCGIDETTFLTFIDGLNAAVSAHPILSAFNLAGAAAGGVPAAVTPIAGLVGLGVQVTARVVTEVRARSSQNSYLEKMNDELFRPHGLYCLVMAYDVKSRSNTVPFDLGANHDATITEPSSPPPQASQSQARLRSNDGVVGAAQFPATAELVFPDPHDEPPPPYDDGDGDASGDSSVKAEPGGGGNSFTKKIAETAASLQSRQDLRAQRKFQRKNPTSMIGSLLDPKAELTPKDIKKQVKREAKQERKAEKQERKAEKRQRKHPEREPKERKVKPLALGASPVHRNLL